jgi:hypothetical protein
MRRKFFALASEYNLPIDHLCNITGSERYHHKFREWTETCKGTARNVESVPAKLKQKLRE